MKNLEWLKEEITEILLTSKKDGTNYFYYRDLKEKIYNAIDQLDKPETLSQAWIDQNHFETENLLEDLYKSDGETIDYTPHIKVIAVQDLQKQNLIAPKQELPVIPKFIAEVIEKDKEGGCDVYDSIYFIIETNGGGLPSISDWVAKNIDKYAIAYLYDYTVEEQKYYVMNKNNKLMLRKYTRGVRELDISNSMSVDSEFFEFERFALTEQEIKDYDERFWPFAKPVEEVE